MKVENMLLRLIAVARAIGLDPSNGLTWKRIYRESDICAEGWFVDGHELSGHAWALQGESRRALFGGPWDPSAWADKIEDKVAALEYAESDAARSGFVPMFSHGTSPSVYSGVARSRVPQ